MKGGFNFRPKGNGSKQGWYSRGYLPHFDGSPLPQFITFRLFDSVPQKLLNEWRQRLNGDDDDAKFRKRVEQYMDLGLGSCFLAKPSIAKLVRDALLFHDAKMYALNSWVIMPNHAHVLLRQMPEVELSDVMHSIKSYTAHEANKILNRTGRFWQPESFDRYIRNGRHFAAVRRYIIDNPVKAGLCARPEEWLYSSASKLSLENSR
jgi:REP element-mobilizing transposase RayT